MKRIVGSSRPSQAIEQAIKHSLSWARLRASLGAGALTLGVMCTVGATTATADESAAPSPQEATLLEEIVVTARFKSESVQVAPISITAVSGEQLEARGFTNISQVATLAPNVNLEAAPAGFGKSVFASIRGIGQNDFKFTLEPGVGFYVDDVYFATVFGSLFTLGDIDRVEVLRGPQGTLFGKNTEGGAIRVFNAKPMGDNSGYAEAGYGTYNRRMLRMALDTALIPEKVFFRLSAGSLQSDGYENVIDFACANPTLAGNIKPTAYGSCNVGRLGGDDVYNIRAAFRVLASDTVEVNLSADLTDDNGPGPADKILAINPNATFLKGFNTNKVIPAFGIPYDARFLTSSPYSTYATFNDPLNGYKIPSDSTLYSWGLNGTVDWQSQWGLHVKSITGLRAEHGEFSQSYSGAPIALSNLYTTLAHRQFTEELQVSGISFNALEWTVGGYYFDGYSHQGGLGDLVEIGLLQVPSDPSTDKNKSVFLHTEYHITDKFSSEVGVRYSSETKTYQYYRLLLAPYQGIPAGNFLFPITSKSLSYNRVDPKFGLQYQWTDDLMSYVSWSSGYKAGGFNTRPVSVAQVTTFLPEKLYTYELGLKSEWLNHLLRANAAVFYSDYRDLQLQASGVDNAGNLAVLTKNVGKARIEGAELEATAEPMARLLIDSAFSYLDYKNLSLGSAAGVSGGPTLASVPPLTPKWKGSLGIQYGIALGGQGHLTPRVDYSYQSLVFNDAPNNAYAAQSGYGVLNAHLTWAGVDSKWSTTLDVNNVTNKVYYIDKFPNYGTYGIIEGQPGMPITVNLRVKHTW